MTGQQQNDNAFVAGWSAASAARLKAAIKRFGSQDTVASRAGISRQSLVEIMRFDEVNGRGSRPRYRTLYAICDAIGVSEDDIVGEASGITVRMPDFTEPLHGDVILADVEYSLVRCYDVNVSAGPGLIPSTEAASSGIAFARSWLLKRGIAADMAGLVTVRGDSMTPTVPDGATVLVDMTRTVEREAVYVFCRAGEVYVKRLHPLSFNDDGRPTSIAVISDNAAYPPEVISGADLQDMRIVGRVRNVMTDLS